MNCMCVRGDCTNCTCARRRQVCLRNCSCLAERCLNRERELDQTLGMDIDALNAALAALNANQQQFQANQQQIGTALAALTSASPNGYSTSIERR